MRVTTLLLFRRVSFFSSTILFLVPSLALAVSLLFACPLARLSLSLSRFLVVVVFRRRTRDRTHSLARPASHLVCQSVSRGEEKGASLARWQLLLRERASATTGRRGSRRFLVRSAPAADCNVVVLAARLADFARSSSQNNKSFFEPASEL